MRASSLLLAAALAGVAPRTADAAEPPAPPARYRSPQMRTAGIVLVSIASASLLGGIGLFTYSYTCSNCGESGAAVAAIMAAGMGGLSVALAAIGVPLWVVGAQPPAAGTAAASRPFAGGLVPVVSAGPRGAVLRWTF